MPKTWDAQWIWLPPRRNRDNLTVHARKSFTLSRRPRQAVIHVTAGSLYRLFVNGAFVGRGPNPADPSYYYYDTYEVGPYLKAGDNVIAVTAYNYGEHNSSVTRQNTGPGGLLLELREHPSDKLLAATDATWRIIAAPEYDPRTRPNNTLFGDYKEICDTRKIPAGWQTIGFNDAAWKKPHLLGKPPVAPYGHLHQREIPMLGGDRYFPRNAFWESASVSYAWRDDWEFYHEQNLVRDNHDAGAKPMEVLKTHDDFSPSVLLDFGTLVTGYPEISVQSSSGGIVDILYGESLHLTRVDRFILNGRPQVLQPFNRRTFRYMKLLFPATPGKVFIDRLWCDMSLYPVKYRGQFHCADDRLNRIYDTARRTIHMSMLDHFVDCPWRERTIYGGDLYVENLLAAYAFGDPRLNHKTLRQLFAIQFKEGALPPLGPYAGYTHFYPAWTAFAALALLDDYQLSGDRAFLEESWPHLQRIIDWTLNQVQHTTPHLIGKPENGDTIAAWSDHGKKRHFTAWDNMPFFLLLKRVADVAGELGHPDDASRCRAAAAMMADAVRSKQLGKDGLFHMYPHKANADQPAMFSNALLAWSNVLNATATRRILNAMLAGKTGLDTCPFHAHFTCDALFSHGRAQAGLDYVRDYFGGMIDRGATTFWEFFSTAWRPDAIPSRGTSFCHGWSGSPAYLLPAYVLGVRPLSPGFDRILIAPPICDLPWAEGAVPTPHGDVRVRWDRAGEKLRLKISTPRPTRVDLPNGSHERPAGEYQWSS